MAEDPERDDDATWLLEPPGSGEIHITLAVGSDVELSVEARAALENLIGLMQDAEVSGFLPPCGTLADCLTFRCFPLGACTPLVSKPCFADVSCKIESTAIR